jgi:hypothetical protein
MKRNFLPHFAELVDRLSINQLKEVFIPEHKDKYNNDMDNIVLDLDSMIQESDWKINGDIIRAIIALSQINAHIWYNESKVRKGESQDLNLLKLTHGLNGIRSNLQNYILDALNSGDRKDWKTDCLAAEFNDWKISFLENEKDIEEE